MNNADFRQMEKDVVISWFGCSCKLEFNSKVEFTSLYTNYLSYCELNKVQVMSKKMFSILLREYLLEYILDGSVKFKPSVKNLYKGIILRNIIEV